MTHTLTYRGAGEWLLRLTLGCEGAPDYGTLTQRIECCPNALVQDGWPTDLILRLSALVSPIAHRAGVSGDIAVIRRNGWHLGRIDLTASVT
jgi:hypothetical protein